MRIRRDAGADATRRSIAPDRRRAGRAADASSLALAGTIDRLAGAHRSQERGLGTGERAALLRSIDTLASGPVRERVLLDAIGEEDGALRLLALQSLARSRSEGAGDAFAEILVRGSDEERSLAIDALLAIDRREDILAAFGDRVEAIAAKAALAYVGTRRRDDYLEILDRRVDRPRRNAILTLLAATLE